MDDLTLTRQELYDLVWSTPLTTLEKTHQLSANDFRTLCKNYHIPLPKSGHWTKVQFGLAVSREPLPDQADPSEIIPLKKAEKKIRVLKDAVPSTSQKNPSANSAAAETEPKQEVLPVITDGLTNTDPLIEQTMKILEAPAKEGGKYLKGKYPSDSLLHIHMSEALKPRALRLLDALMKICESRGYQIQYLHRKTLLTRGETEMHIRPSAPMPMNWKRRWAGSLPVKN